MSKTYISINAIAATLADNAALLAEFGQTEAPRKAHEAPLTARELLCTAAVVGLYRHVPEAYWARICETIEISDDGSELLVDLGKVGALMTLCAKLFAESQRKGHRHAMRSLGLDDCDAANAGQHLLPLLKAVAATVRAQAVALKIAV